MISERTSLWFARFVSAVALAALLAGALRGELKIEGDTKVKEHKLVVLTAAGYEKGAAVLWRWDKQKLDGRRTGNTLVLTGPPGSYVVEASALRLDKDGNTTAEQVDVTVTIGAGAPSPPGPKPPDPRPDDPKPPAPDRKLTRVLVVYESGTTLPVGQHNLVYGPTFRKYLDTVTPKAPGGKVHNWNIWDKDDDVSSLDVAWKDMHAKGKDKVPALVLGDDAGTITAVPLPADAKAAQDLINSYLPRARRKGDK